MELLREHWVVFVALVSAIAWAVRLEAGMLGNRKDIKRMEDQRRDDMKDAERHRDKVDVKLSGIETDIKQILLLLSSKADR